MIKNYLKTALRTLRRNKLFSLINVLGLSVGLSAAMIIYLIVRYDFSFEQSRPEKDQIYRVVTSMNFSGSPFPNSGVPFPVVEASRRELRGIDGTAAFFTVSSRAAIPKPNGAPAEFKHLSDVIYTDEHYFQLFPTQWLAGTGSSLNQLSHVAITEDRAKTYFPGLTASQAIGRTIIYDDSIPCVVTGVIKDEKNNTDMAFKEFISLPTIYRSSNKQLADSSWSDINSATQLFIRLEKGTKPQQIEQQLAILRKKYSKDAGNPNSTFTHLLQPLTDIHFTSKYDAFGQRQASRSSLYGLLVIAIFLLCLGSINFINLTTAQAAQRAKEIGIRKTMGSSRRQLITQFLSEAFLLTLVSTILSLMLAPWLMKLFTDFIPKGLQFQLSGSLYLFLGLLILTVTLLSGFYPALVLSRFKPVLAMKNQAFSNKSTTRNAMLRQTLTIFQFVIAQAFIIGTIIVSSQIHYSLNKDMGFKKDAIFYFYSTYNGSDLAAKNRLLQTRLRSIPGITQLSVCGPTPASGWVNSEVMVYNDGKKDITANLQMLSVDSSYMRLYGLKLLAGRNIMQGADSPRQLVINRTYAQILGFTHPRDAVGKFVSKSNLVVGVMEDFHQTSLHKAIEPLALNNVNNMPFQFFHVALSNTPEGRAGWKNTIAAVQREYNKVFPGEEFEHTFIDESIARFYTAEQQMSSLLRWATGLTIFISCLGLLGLVIYATNLRTKEIGVRKVLGATVTQIITLLSRDFVKLVLIAFVIAVPAAWYATHRWMENFAYRTTISGWIYALSGGAMLVMALLTLSIQTIRAANANPVKSLRTE